MGKLLEIKYDDVERFSCALKGRSKKIDDVFINICDVAMENTLTEAEKRTPVRTGRLKKAWRNNVEGVGESGDKFSEKATNDAFNWQAALLFMDPHYAEFVEKGHKKVPWRKSTRGVHMLANAEEDTQNKMEKFVDDEIKKFFGGLFD